MGGWCRTQSLSWYPSQKWCSLGEGVGAAFARVLLIKELNGKGGAAGGARAVCPSHFGTCEASCLQALLQSGVASATETQAEAVLRVALGAVLVLAACKGRRNLYISPIYLYLLRKR